MAAMWMVEYDAFRWKQGSPDRQSFLLYAADAKSMKRKDLNAAVRNAKTRAKKRLKTRERGVRTKLVSVRCVG